MSSLLNLFSLKNNYYKNGIWWFTKILNRAVGETRYDYLRVTRRVWSMKFYYARQQVLYEVFLEHPEHAQLLGIYPKVDSSHGFAHYNTYEMWRDNQENNINSDGSFSMYIYLLCGLYMIHYFFTYHLPYYHVRSPLQNGQESRQRMVEAFAVNMLEEIYGIHLGEWSWMPHDFAYARRRGIQGYQNPDDVRAMHFNSFNRQNRYKEHYIDGSGKGTSMTQ